jgi:hypothetical protein
MIIDGKVAGEYPDPSKEGKGLNLKNGASAMAVKSPRPAPSIKREAGLGYLFTDYLSTKD